MPRSIRERAARGDKLLFGVVHLLPLAGSPRASSRADVLERARTDADALVGGGLDGFIVENFGDAPFFAERVPPVTIAEMAVVVARLRELSGPGPLIGVNVLRNDARAALAIATAAEADFIRVNVHTGVMYADQGMLEGRAAETLRERRALDARVEILADVGVKHAVPPAGFSLAQSAKDTAHRGLADGLIVTGSGTGQPTELETIRTVRAAVADRPLFVGSGVTAESVAALLASADGAIVGTSLKEAGIVGNPVSPERVRALCRALRG